MADANHRQVVQEAAEAGHAVIGKRVPRVDALDKVTGAAKYGADINLPGQLWGKFLHSPHAHARVLSIDTTKAEALQGVRLVLTQSNLNAEVDEHRRLAGLRIPEDLFAADRVLYHGHRLALIIADSPLTAEDALPLIEVKYELLPHVTDVAKAVKASAPRLHGETGITTPEGETLYNVSAEDHFQFGDVEKGFAESDVVIEATYTVPRVHQTYVEPYAVLAEVSASGKVTVWTSTQTIFGLRSELASTLGIRESEVNVIGATVGGAFGGKYMMFIHHYVVIASALAGRPVKIAWTREEELMDGRPAPGCVFWVKTGAKKDGTILARQARAFWDVGSAYGGDANWSTGRILGVYKIQNLKWDAYSIYTNTPQHTAYRAPGAPQITYASEAQLDELAAALGMDPVELRLVNMAEDGDAQLDSEPLARVAFKETLRKVAESAGWSRRAKGPNEGWGVAVGEWTNCTGPAGAIVTLQEDGTVRLFYGMADITGTDTGCAQIAAEVLGLPYEDVRVVRGDTDSTPYVIGSGGSVVLYSVGNAVKRAAEDARRQVLELASAELEVPADRLTVRDRKVFSLDDGSKYLSLAELGQASLRSTLGPIVGHGRFSSEPSNPVIAAQIAKVRVDPDTGKITLLRFAGALDVGEAINPTQCEGQMEGAVTQALSWAWMEEMKYDDDGHPVSALVDYHIPTTADMPLLESFLVERPSQHGPFGVKGIGEPPITPGMAVLHAAVADAVGVRVRELPMTTERIVSAIRSRDGGVQGR